MVTPATNQTGSTVISVTATDPCGLNAISSFTLTVNPTNTPPTISPIADVAIEENTSTRPLNFTANDAETDASRLTLSAMYISSPSNLLQSVVLGGTDTNRTITLTPTTNFIGTAVVTVVVADEEGGQASASFTVNVTFCDSCQPRVGRIPDQTVLLNSIVGLIPFSVDNIPGLVLAANSSNTALVPNENIAFVGTGVNLALLITPATNMTGIATISITASDGVRRAATTSFKLTVLSEIRLNAQRISVSGALQLRLAGFTGQGGLIQSSTDLKSWQPIYTNTAPDGQLPPLDFDTTAQPWQFFRALLSK